MSRRLVWRIALIFIGFTLLVTMAGCSMTTPSGDDSSDDTGGIETNNSKEDNETATDSGPTGTDSAGGGSESTSESPDNSTSETGNESGSNGAADQSTTTGPIDDTGLPVDENRIYNLTRNLIDSDADAPAITIEELSNRTEVYNPFFDYMGLTSESEEGSGNFSPAAVARGPDSVIIDEAIFDRYYEEATGRFDLILAHEFAHTIQMEEGWLDRTRRVLARTSGLSTPSIESSFLYKSLLEGGAVFTADEYADRTEGNVSQIDRYEQEYRDAPAELVHAYGPFHHGGQYFQSVLDSAEELGSAYTDDIPTSTEELLHPGYNDTGYSDVTFSAQSSRDDWTQQTAGYEVGAMFVHFVLTAHAERDAAAEASKGWGNDQLFKFENETRSAFTWVTHWDSAADADQFAEAFNRTLPNRSDDDVGDIEVARAGNRSVVVLAGPAEFRDAIAIDGENADVDIILQSGAEDSVESIVPVPVDTDVNLATGRG